MKNLPTFQIIQVENLILNSDSFRIPKSFQSLSEAEIIRHFEYEEVLNKLMLSIGQNGFYYHEPLLVKYLDIGKYKVIDGNRRLLAVKLLLNPESATVNIASMKAIMDEVSHSPKEVPCLVFQDEIGIKEYLGFNHINGVKTWRMLEKATFIYGFYKSNSDNYTLENACRIIAKTIGTRKEYIRQMIISFEVYSIIEEHEFFKIKDLNDRTFNFHHIIESIKYPNIRAFLSINYADSNPLENVSLKNLEKWAKWIFEDDSKNLNKVLGDEQSLFDLDIVLSNEKSKEAFENGATLQESKSITFDKTFQDLILQSVQALEEAMLMSNRVKSRTAIIERDLKNIDSIVEKLLAKLQHP